jgi:hypothetical protein
MNDDEFFKEIDSMKGEAAAQSLRGYIMTHGPAVREVMVRKGLTLLQIQPLVAKRLKKAVNLRSLAIYMSQFAPAKAAIVKARSGPPVVAPPPPTPPPASVIVSQTNGKRAANASVSNVQQTPSDVGSRFIAEADHSPVDGTTSAHQKIAELNKTKKTRDALANTINPLPEPLD